MIFYLISKNSIKDHYETSAKTAQNVQEAFESMVKKIDPSFT